MFDWIETFDLICFDFDGLLVNTEDLHFLAYQKVLEDYGFSLPWDFQNYCTEAHISTEVLRSAIYGLFPKLLEMESDWEVVREKKNAIYKGLLSAHEIKLMPGVRELLSRLASSVVKSCVVTNSTKAQTDEIRSLLPDLNQIPYWFNRETYAKAKPEPDGYLKALETLKVSKERVIGFEDTMKGANALTKAGIRPILIWPKSYPPHHTKLTSFSSFLDLKHSSTL
jgi:beta-phosphoglucomutase